MVNRFSYNINSNKTIWIDLDNSPHVPFFMPIIKNLEAQGYNVKLSARNYSQTVLLASKFGLDFTPIGKHHGKNKFIKILGLIYRAIQLFPFALKSKAHIAVSHGSRSQMVVAFILRIPIVMLLDYEFIQTIPFVKPKLILLPHIISTKHLQALGAKIISYPGIKEDVYVPSFVPNSRILKELSLVGEDIIVVLRPPAYQAHYHNPDSEKLFKDIIHILVHTERVKTIILPRDERQKLAILTEYKKYFIENRLIIPAEVVDGLNLIWYSDLVISGGGTMNREAAALNVPVYSIFKGRIGDVDKYLSEKGKLIIIEDVNDFIAKVKFIKRTKSIAKNNINSLALQTIVNNLSTFVDEVTSQNKNYSINAENEKPLSSKRNENT